MTFERFSSTPVRLRVLPKTCAEPARTPETVVTFGAFASSFSAATVSGVNVSVDVSA